MTSDEIRAVLLRKHTSHGEIQKNGGENMDVISIAKSVVAGTALPLPDGAAAVFQEALVERATKARRTGETVEQAYARVSRDDADGAALFKAMTTAGRMPGAASPAQMRKALGHEIIDALASSMQLGDPTLTHEAAYAKAFFAPANREAAHAAVGR